MFITRGLNSNAKEVSGHEMYGTKVTKIAYQKNSWLISGTTSAPDGYKVLATPTAKNNMNYGSQVSETNAKAVYPKVKNGKFKLIVSPDDAVDPDNSRTGEKTKLAIFAVDSFSEDAIDVPNWSKIMLTDSKNIFVLKLKQKQVDYINYLDKTDDNSSSESTETSSSQNGSSSSESSSSENNNYPDVNVTFPNGILNSSETELTETQFHLDGKVTDLGADGIGNYHILITAKNDSEPKYLLVVDHKKTGRVNLNDKISFDGSATGLGSINSSQIDAGLSEEYHNQKVALLDADKVKIN